MILIFERKWMDLDETSWTRMLYLFTSIEAIVSVVIGFLFGKEVHKKAAEGFKQAVDHQKCLERDIKTLNNDKNEYAKDLVEIDDEIRKLKKGLDIIKINNLPAFTANNIEGIIDGICDKSSILKTKILDAKKA